MERILREQAEAARYLRDPQACIDYAERNGCTPEQARAGAAMGASDWLAEEVLERREMARAGDAARSDAAPGGKWSMTAKHGRCEVTVFVLDEPLRALIAAVRNMLARRLGHKTVQLRLEE